MLAPSTLPPSLLVPALPVPVAKPEMIVFNARLGASLGGDFPGFGAAENLGLFSGERRKRPVMPVATAYSGHQFGLFAPTLGDGRVLLLGESVDRKGNIYEVQIKGSGRTPFSRGGDGRAPLAAVAKEYLMSEAMAALGVATTRSLAIISTGETVQRKRVVPGAILVRIARSHVRVGTFQYLAARGDVPALEDLARVVASRHYEELAGPQLDYRALLDCIIERQVRLVAQWMSVGFVHGVLNTDNVAVGGDTIDYGPCAFLDDFTPEAAFSEIDTSGRYAYAQQPAIMRWNLARLAECFVPLLGLQSSKPLQVAQDCIDKYDALYEAAYMEKMRAKVGLVTAQRSDPELIDRLLAIMKEHRADFTWTFRALDRTLEHGHPGELSSLGNSLVSWIGDWRKRILVDHPDPAGAIPIMQGCNPIVAPRTHAIEKAVGMMVEMEDSSEFLALLAASTDPFKTNDDGRYELRPDQKHANLPTTCGT